jgi:hypothetical protein
MHNRGQHVTHKSHKQRVRRRASHEAGGPHFHVYRLIGFSIPPPQRGCPIPSASLGTGSLRRARFWFLRSEQRGVFENLNALISIVIR